MRRAQERSVISFENLTSNVESKMEDRRDVSMALLGCVQLRIATSDAIVPDDEVIAVQDIQGIHRHETVAKKKFVCGVDRSKTLYIMVPSPRSSTRRNAGERTRLVRRRTTQEPVATLGEGARAEDGDIEVLEVRPPAESGTKENPIIIGIDSNPAHVMQESSSSAIELSRHMRKNTGSEPNGLPAGGPSGVRKLPASGIARSLDEANPSAEKLSVLNASLVESLHCAICTEIIYRCVTIYPCAHKFCAGCLSMWMAQAVTCPICRGNVVVPMRDGVMDVIIERVLQANPNRRRLDEECERLDAADTITLLPPLQRRVRYTGVRGARAVRGSRGRVRRGRRAARGV
ncbi:E3 ubiquitin-protein ligase CHFR [Toxocara canis]|uniref:E3 ubiquitin-protein ligase CHFR n=1 Tax=Toxocara canis TaxID=6265 RepID=A0A0B2VTR3_TOXCA|nr:E3 ubiquitin-protein ligase CHFR [Toxocara canis]